MNSDQTAPFSLIWVHIICNIGYLRTEADARADDKSPGPKVIQLFILNSAEHEIYPVHKC